MPMLQEIHGVSGLSRTPKDGADSSQEVIVRDRDGHVTIEIHHPHSYGARLTPEEAEYLAATLWGAAKRARGEPIPADPPSIPVRGPTDHFYKTVSSPFNGTVEPKPAPVVEWGGPNHQVPTGRPLGLDSIADVTWNAGLAGTPADESVEIRSEGRIPAHRREPDPDDPIPF